MTGKTYCATTLDGAYVPGKTVLTSALPYGYDELTDINTYDPEGAAKLLDDAGYKDIDGDGYRETPDGETLTLPVIIYVNRTEIPLMAEAIQIDCGKIGIRIEIKAMEQASAFNMLTAGEYDMLIMSITMATAGDPENSLRSYFETYDAEDPNYNAGGYSSERVDSLLQELSGEFDTDRRTGLIKEIQQTLLDDTACWNLCYPTINFGMKASVDGFSEPSH